MIRELRNNDLDRVMTIWLESNISAHSFIDEDFWQGHYDDVKSILPEASVYVYEQGGIIKGFIGIVDDSYIAGLFVDDLWQRHGVGRELLEYCKRLYSCLQLDVYVKNEKAVNFYSANGFVKKSEQVNADTGEAEYRMICN